MAVLGLGWRGWGGIGWGWGGIGWRWGGVGGRGAAFADGMSDNPTLGAWNPPWVVLLLLLLISFQR